MNVRKCITPLLMAYSISLFGLGTAHASGTGPDDNDPEAVWQWCMAETTKWQIWHDKQPPELAVATSYKTCRSDFKTLMDSLPTDSARNSYRAKVKADNNSLIAFGREMLRLGDPNATAENQQPVESGSAETITEKPLTTKPEELVTTNPKPPDTAPKPAAIAPVVDTAQATQHQDSSKQEAEQNAASTKKSDANSQLSALDKMAIVFKGGYSKDQIELEAATVLRLFDQSLSDINYEHLGNVLLSLSDGIKPNTEMDILDCMKTLKRGASNVNMDIPGAAAICATTISIGL